MSRSSRFRGALPGLAVGDAVGTYAHLLGAAASGAGREVAVHRLSIRDLSIPGADHMAQIQDVIDRALAEERSVYVHCWGERGRTGTVVGIHLIRHGLAATRAVGIRRRRRSRPRS